MVYGEASGFFEYIRPVFIHSKHKGAVDRNALFMELFQRLGVFVGMIEAF